VGAVSSDARGGARDGRQLPDDASRDSAVDGATQRLDVAATTGRPAGDAPAAPSGADGIAATTAATAATAAGNVDGLLTRVVERIRTVSGQSDPALEAKIHDPELGTIRLQVAGRAGDVVRAELVVTDRRLADALARAVDRSSAGHGLTGIDLRIRTESAGLDSGRMGSGATPDRGGQDPLPSGWSGAAGGDGSRQGATLGHDDAGRGRSAPSPQPAAPAFTRRGRASGSLDVRA
jgi:hypothetical protein